MRTDIRKRIIIFPEDGIFYFTSANRILHFMQTLSNGGKQNLTELSLESVPMFLQYIMLFNSTIEFKGCLWKQRTHKRTNIGDSVLLIHFNGSNAICKVQYAPLAPA